MARVDLNQFTIAMNSFEELINSVKAEVESMSSAAAVLAGGMTGEEAEQLIAKCKALTTQLYEQESKIRGVIGKVQSDNNYYIHGLGVLE